MYGQPAMEREWSLHAQLTISHGGAGPSLATATRPLITSNASQTAHPSACVSNLPGGGVHMEYSWKNGSKYNTSQSLHQKQDNPQHSGNIVFSLKRHPGEPRSHSFHFVPMSGGIQHSHGERFGNGEHGRGVPNIRVVPPSASEEPSRGHHQDCGYFSSPTYATLPRCSPSHSSSPMHTCTFVLSSNVPSYANQVPSTSQSSKVFDSQGFPIQGQLLLYPGQTVRLDLPRSQSLRSTFGPPTPVNRNSWTEPAVTSVKPLRPTSLNVPSAPLSPHQESKGDYSHTSTFLPDSTSCPSSVHRKEVHDASCHKSDTHCSNRDASCQTPRSAVKKHSSQTKTGGKSYETRRKTDTDLPSTTSSFHLHPPSSHHYEMGEEVKRNKLRRSPARLRGTSPYQGMKPKASTSFSLKTEGKKRQKPRTVHIDVYCTASEDDADASQSASSHDDGKHSSEEDSTSSPQTVYESEEFRVVHSKAKKNQFPAAFLQKNGRKDETENIAANRCVQSSEIKEAKIPETMETSDSLCPSMPSSFESKSFKDEQPRISRGVSGIGACGGCGGPTRDPSWSTLSASSDHPFMDEDDSDSTATSWKDTVTDLGENDVERSFSSLVQSDSFEYADNEDLHRIKEKELEWSRISQGNSSIGRNIGPRTWRSPQVERLQYLQQLRFKHLIAKHMRKPSPRPSDKCSEDSLESSDIGEDSDVIQKSNVVVKGLNVKDTSSNHGDNLVTSLSPTNLQCRPTVSPPVQLRRALSPRWVAPLGGPYVPQTDSPKSPDIPSSPIDQQKSSVMSPFTSNHGTRTSPLMKAQRFGTIVGKIRKPGHHVGPSKNAECGCEHCRRYFESSEVPINEWYRGRTKSVGDMPYERERTGPWSTTSMQTSLTAAVESQLNIRSNDSCSHVPSLSDSEVDKGLACSSGKHHKSQNEKARKSNTSNGSHVEVFSGTFPLVGDAYGGEFLQAQVSLAESSRKLDLLRKSLELRRQELPPDSPAAAQLKCELQNVQAASPVPVTYTSLQPFRNSSGIVGTGGAGEVTRGSGSFSFPGVGKVPPVSSLGRAAAVTGKLEVRLMGCQDLLEEVPGRSRRDKEITGSPGDLRSFVKGVTSRSSSKSYSVKDETSNEIMAVLKLDNQTVGQTNWRPCSQQAWDQSYTCTYPQPLQLVFDSSTVEEKPEAPGELPDPLSAGLSGARPLGLGVTTSSSTSSISSSSSTAATPSSSLPPPLPETPPPSSTSASSKKRVPPPPSAVSPRLDVENYWIILKLLLIIFKLATFTLLENIVGMLTALQACYPLKGLRFSIDLDKSRELEIGIFWRDWRSLCAIKFLRLEEFIDDVRHGMALQLEPQGLLFAEIKFLNPMISRKPKLQRQKKIFKQQGKNFPRPNQMNINVATWGRLLKRSNPSIQNNQENCANEPSTPEVNTSNKMLMCSKQGALCESRPYHGRLPAVLCLNIYNALKNYFQVTLYKKGMP
ncbi:hypothetical protein J437_LFUL001816 [Ladona fulva]|uniref:Uncharacterized protein n=1 Tax=Ladona fulva TaxID=123851 RepID=A0A8K0NWD3_LADFU|nr:hypothetical protein J437_LFUL001816 [Ladona fulva]